MPLLGVIVASLGGFYYGLARLRIHLERKIEEAALKEKVDTLLAIHLIEQASLKQSPLTSDDIMNICANLSNTVVYTALKQLVAKGEIKVEGNKGHFVYYRID